MKIGIISDSHDHLENFEKAREEMEGEINVLIHCGDFCAPFMIAEMEEFGVPVHCVFGNIDDRHTTTKMASNTQNVKLYGNTARFEVDGKKILVNHYPDIARAFAKTEDYDLVCHGHNHLQKKEKIGSTLLVNPGEIMGRKEKLGYAVYDTETGEVELRKL